MFAAKPVSAAPTKRLVGGNLERTWKSVEQLDTLLQLFQCVAKNSSEKKRVKHLLESSRFTPNMDDRTRLGFLRDATVSSLCYMLLANVDRQLSPDSLQLVQGSKEFVRSWKDLKRSGGQMVDIFCDSIVPPWKLPEPEELLRSTVCMNSFSGLVSPIPQLELPSACGSSLVPSILLQRLLRQCAADETARIKTFKCLRDELEGKLDDLKTLRKNLSAPAPSCFSLLLVLRLLISQNPGVLRIDDLSSPLVHECRETMQALTFAPLPLGAMARRTIESILEGSHVAHSRLHALLLYKEGSERWQRMRQDAFSFYAEGGMMPTTNYGGELLQIRNTLVKTDTLFEAVSFEKVEANGGLSNLVQSLRTRSAALRCCVVGDDECLAAFLPLYVKLCDSAWHLGEALQVYLLPGCTAMGGTDRFADFVASYDAWYHLHVMVPLSTPLPYVPCADLDDSILSEAPSRFPAETLAQNIDQYLRSAEELYPCSMYTLEGTNLQGGKERLPVLQRVEVGIGQLESGALTFFQKSQSPGGPRSWFDVIQSGRTMRFPNVKLKATYKQLKSGFETHTETTRLSTGQDEGPVVETKEEEAGEVKPDEELSVCALLISSIPRLGERVPVAPPGSSGLLLSIVSDTPDTGTSGGGPNAGRRVSKGKPSESVSDRNLCVSNITVKVQSSGGVLVLCDGLVKGPFSDFSVKPTETADGNHLRLPLMHFTPLDV